MLLNMLLNTSILIPNKSKSATEADFFKFVPLVEQELEEREVCLSIKKIRKQI